jgi:hypothetical protein
MKKTMKTKAKKLNPVTGNVKWVDDFEIQVHPDHRQGPLEREEQEHPEGYDPYHGWTVEGLSY